MVTGQMVPVYLRHMQKNATNPIRVARKERGWTLKEMAAKAGVHVQALYLNECGCYPHVLPSVLRLMVHVLDRNPAQVEKEYNKFVADKRLTFGGDHALNFYTLDHLGEPRIHPLLAFRDSLRLSRMGFAKAICVQPTMLYNVENCQARRLPSELLKALKDAGLSRQVLLELSLRYEDWCFD
jgi:DNA-binding XRE family transcriptional regulator